MLDDLEKLFFGNVDTDNKMKKLINDRDKRKCSHLESWITCVLWNEDTGSESEVHLPVCFVFLDCK